MNSKTPLFQHYKNKLAQSPVFSGLSDELLKDMLEQFHHTTWRKGIVVDASLLTERFYLIIDGRLRIDHIDTISGDQVTPLILGPGDGIDVISLLDGQFHDILPVALEDLNLLGASTQDIRGWINQHPEFNRNFLPYLGHRMRQMEALTTDLASKNTIIRLARLILRHTAPDSTNNDGPYPVRLIHDLTDDILAKMIGSTRQVVNQHLQALRQKGILDGHSKVLAVLELEKLKDATELFFPNRHKI